MHVHPLLIRFWADLGLTASDRVFVPLCGKSLDLMWLHEQGHHVVGIELSPLAVQAFFKESAHTPRQARHGALTRWSSERLTIYCGDFFRLTARDLQGVRVVYDRASLTALPEAQRASYVAHLVNILPAGCQVLLLTVEDLDDGESEAWRDGQFDTWQVGVRSSADRLHLSLSRKETLSSSITLLLPAQETRAITSDCVIESDQTGAQWRTLRLRYA